MSPVLLPALILSVTAGAAAIARVNPLTIARRGAALALAAAVALIAWALAVGGDALALAVTALTATIAFVCLAFSERHLRADADRRGFAIRASLVAATVPAMAGADSLVVLVGGWVASGWLLADLIGHRREWAEARQAARRARASFAIGDAALLAAAAILAVHAGGLGIEQALAGVSTLNGLAGGSVAMLLLVAAMSRSALPPFAGWLTGSMAAPTPVSALMHGGLVNAGGFLLVRFAPVLEAAPAIRWATMTAGVAAVLWGTGMALVRSDTKRALAGSTVAQMGFSFLCCGLGAYAAAIWHLVAHGLFKAWLFLGAGSTAVRPSASALGAIVTGPIVLAVTAGGLVALTLAAEWPTPELLPIALAVAAGVAASLTALRHSLGLTGGSVLVAGALAYGAGLAGFAAALPHAAVPLPGGTAAALVLFGGFAAAWVAQARGRTLPPSLYTRLASA